MCEYPKQMSKRSRDRLIFTRRVWAYLSQCRDPRHGRVVLHVRQTARALGASPSRVSRAIDTLLTLGYLRRLGVALAPGRRLGGTQDIVEVVVPFTLLQPVV